LNRLIALKEGSEFTLRVLWQEPRPGSREKILKSKAAAFSLEFWRSGCNIFWRGSEIQQDERSGKRLFAQLSLSP
jgi:hypothetical protein